MNKKTSEEIKKLNKILKNKEKAYFVLFDLGFKKEKIKEIPDNISIIEFLQKEYPRGFEFRPQYFLNDEEVMVKDFDKKIKKGDVFFVFPKIELNFVAMLVINIIIAFVMKQLFPAPKMKSPDNKQYPSLYNSNVSQIEAKKGGPVPYVSGVVRMYPQLITPNYTTISRRGDAINETSYVLCCLGEGEIDVIQFYVNNSQMETL